MTYARYRKTFPDWSPRKAGICTLLTLTIVVLVGLSLLLGFLLFVGYYEPPQPIDDTALLLEHRRGNELVLAVAGVDDHDSFRVLG